MNLIKRWIVALCLAVGLIGSTSAADAADNVKVALLRIGAGAPLFIAKEKGYLDKEGLTVEFAFTDQPQTLLAGPISGDIDFSITGPSAAFFNIAAQGAIRIIAGNVEETPTFQAFAVVAGNRSYQAGLKSMQELGSHSDAIAVGGTPPQYALALLAEKFGFDYSTVKILQLGNLPNMISAVVGGGADFTIVPGTYIRPALQNGQLQNLGWFGDVARMQVQFLITSTKIADTKADLVKRFLLAYRAGAKDYHDAFADQDGKRRDGPAAAETYATIAKYLNEPPDVAKLGVAYIDDQGRLDVADVVKQAAWYKSQGMVKSEVGTAILVDARYVLPLLPK